MMLEVASYISVLRSLLRHFNFGELDAHKLLCWCIWLLQLISALYRTILKVSPVLTPQASLERLGGLGMGPILSLLIHILCWLSRDPWTSSQRQLSYGSAAIDGHLTILSQQKYLYHGGDFSIPKQAFDETELIQTIIGEYEEDNFLNMDKTGLFGWDHFLPAHFHLQESELTWIKPHWLCIMYKCTERNWSATSLPHG